MNLVDPDGDESTNPPIYPCYEHATLTDVLSEAKVSWKYYATTAGSIWTAPNAINHICVPKMQNGQLVCTGPDWVNNVVVGSKQVLKDIQDCELASVSWVMPPSAGQSWQWSILKLVGQTGTLRILDDHNRVG